MYINDTVVSKILDDGALVGYSVLSDITNTKKENNALYFLNGTIPCGFLKYTCEKQPKITYINNRMMDLLRFPVPRNGEQDYMELYKDNVFLLIPVEERRRFALYLNRVYSGGVPVAGEIALLRCDGSRVHVFGWVTKCVDDQGREEFQSVCMDITERREIQKANETKRYLKALTDVYNAIFEYDLNTNTVKCLYRDDTTMLKWLENIPMQIEEATEKWIIQIVAAEDQDRIRSFFRDFIISESHANPAQNLRRSLIKHRYPAKKQVCIAVFFSWWTM